MEYVSKITILDLTIMVKSGLEFFYFEIPLAPSEIPANLPGYFSLFCTGQQQSTISVFMAGKFGIPVVIMTLVYLAVDTK